MKRLLRTLNQPFILWLLSSVVVGFISWQYAQIQKVSEARKIDEYIVRRAKLELKLQLQDVQFIVRQDEDMTMAQLGSALSMLQYNALSQGNMYYVPSIPNLMLELDSRTTSCGLEKYQGDIYKKATRISTELNRLWSRGAQPQWLIHSQLSDETLAGLGELVGLADEVKRHYAQTEPECVAN